MNREIKERIIVQIKDFSYRLSSLEEYIRLSKSNITEKDIPFGKVLSLFNEMLADLDSFYQDRAFRMMSKVGVPDAIKDLFPPECCKGGNGYEGL